jgi:hypothetical protein
LTSRFGPCNVRCKTELEGDRAEAGEQPVSAAFRERSCRRLPSWGRTEAEIVDVIVQLSPEAADAVHGGDPTPSNLREAQQKLRSLGLRLEPLHVRAEDPSLAAWFRVSVDDEPTAEEVAATLRTSPAVKSAYVEPPSAPPAEATPATEEEANAMDP